MTQQPLLLVDCHKIISTQPLSIDWLLQRKKVSKDWYTYEKAAQQKIKILLKQHQIYNEYPFITQYLKQNSQGFHYCDIVILITQLLKTKLAQPKSLVFGYTNPIIRQWTKLKKFMENHLISIISTAKFINQSLNFQLPNLDKNIELMDSQLTNLRRKIDFNANTIHQQTKQANAEKLKIGLMATDDTKNTNSLSVLQQIPNLIHQIPTLFHKAEQHAKNLSKYYQLYLKYCQESKLDDINRLEILEYFINHGDIYISQINQYPQQQSPSPQIQLHQKYTSYKNWTSHNQWGIQTSSSTSTPTSNTPQSTPTLLENRPARLSLLQDLNQLQYFYRAIRYQQKQKNNLTLMQEPTTTLIQSEIDQVITNIENLVGLINGDIANWVQIKQNPNAYRLLLLKFRCYQQNIEHMLNQNQQYQKQIEQIKLRREQLVKSLRKLRLRLVQSKNQCQKYLTELVKRDVKITGEINKLE